MRLVVNSGPLSLKMVYALLRGGTIFVGVFDTGDHLVVTLGIKDKSGTPIAWQEWASDGYSMMSITVNKARTVQWREK